MSTMNPVNACITLQGFYDKLGIPCETKQEYNYIRRQWAMRDSYNQRFNMICEAYLLPPATIVGRLTICQGDHCREHCFQQASLEHTNTFALYGSGSNYITYELPIPSESPHK